MSFNCAAQHDLYFKRIERGLANLNVSVVLEDSRGFIWIGTRNGLHRYDGSTFRIYETNKNDSNSLPHGYVHDLWEDATGHLWIATFGGGISRYSPDHNTFTHFRATHHEPNGLMSDHVFSIFDDGEGHLWFGTENGVSIFDLRSGRFTRHLLAMEPIRCIFRDSNGYLWLGGRKLFRFFGTDGQSEKQMTAITLPTEDIRSIVEDNDHNIWVATWDAGLFQNPHTALRHLQHEPGNVQSLSTNNLLTLMPDDTVLWVGTENGGLNVLNLQTKNVTRYVHQKNDYASLGHNSVFEIYKDSKHRIWLGLFHNGLNLLDPEQREFIFYSNEGFGGLPSGSVGSFAEMPKGQIWIGSDGGGVSQFHKAQKTFHTINEDSGLPVNAVLTLSQTDNGQLLIGSWAGGLTAYDPLRKKFEYFKHQPEQPTSISGNFVINILKDPTQKNRFWVSSWEHGLEYFHADTETFMHYGWHPQSAYTPGNQNIFHMCYDRAGNLWLATNNGLNKGTRTASGDWIFQKYYNNPKQAGSLSENSINTVFADAKDLLWVGTVSSGLDLYVPATGQFRNWNEKDGLPGNSVVSIISDAPGTLWVATNKGLSKVSYTGANASDIQLTFANFDETDGIRTGDFHHNSAFIDSDGWYYFGGKNGFTLFDPDRIYTNREIPKVYFTDFKLFNESVPIDTSAQGILQQDISFTRALSLHHSQNFFSIQFSALDFINPSKVKYAYRLQGLEENWIHTSRNEANYVHVPPGEYFFHVKAQNSDGVWNETGASLIIRIQPPFWKTLWFRLATTLLMGALVLLYFRYRTRSIVKARDKLEMEVKTRTQQLQDALNQLRKAQYELIQAEKLSSLGTLTSGLAHELNNPLNYIRGGLNILKEHGTNETEDEQTAMRLMEEGIDRSTQIIKRLSILSLKVSEGGKERIDLGHLLPYLLQDYVQDCPDISFHFESQLSDEVRVYPEIIRHIVRNICDNAIYATREVMANPKDRQVYISIGLRQTSEDRSIEISIENTGNPIPGDEMDRIFDPFYTTKPPRSGAGLGLAISHFLAEQHDGSIHVENTSRGVRFSVLLPFQSEQSDYPDFRAIVDMERGSFQL